MVERKSWGGEGEGGGEGVRELLGCGGEGGKKGGGRCAPVIETDALAVFLKFCVELGREERGKVGDDSDE